MRRLFVIIVLVVVNFSYSQIVSGVVKDSVSKNSLPYANIVLMNGRGFYATDRGEFTLDISNSIYDTLKISLLGYKPKLIPLQQYKELSHVSLDVLLATNLEELNEVVVSSEKVKYKDREVLGESREGNIGMTSLIGYETCVLIENPRKIRGKVKRVYIELKRRKNANYIATFNIKFYRYNKETNTPGEELYDKNIYVDPKNRKYRLWIDVEDFNVVFPDNGVCVGVEMVNTVGKVEKYAYFGPMFRYTRTAGKPPVTWSNYHNRGWKSTLNKTEKYKRFKGGIFTPMIGVEVLYPSK